MGGRSWKYWASSGPVFFRPSGWLDTFLVCRSTLESSTFVIWLWVSLRPKISIRRFWSLVTTTTMKKLTSLSKVSISARWCKSFTLSQSKLTQTSSPANRPTTAPEIWSESSEYFSTRYVVFCSLTVAKYLPALTQLFRALIKRCNNAEHPDLYGHYREAKFTQTKHHWWWKANRVFNELEVTRNYTG